MSSLAQVFPPSFSIILIFLYNIITLSCLSFDFTLLMYFLYQEFLFPVEYLISDLRMSDCTIISTVRRSAFQALNYFSITNSSKSTRSRSINFVVFFFPTIFNHLQHIDLSPCWSKRRSCFAITLRMLMVSRDGWVSRISLNVTVREKILNS